ncbi:hypothetical protein FLP10_06425 [Agromyces intestinalis]|uniref:Uncharacterized protein n=1 Tax=Agromyces intestinalis TaxID=2592652 RepID=A0A5C1YDF7_9MICO|nr:hypothetical protein [Agromyces intestinalis]QEO14096.1 hypothetical protein FLP10_06425 [Agromyces intestinalis]
MRWPWERRASTADSPSTPASAAPGDGATGSAGAGGSDGPAGAAAPPAYSPAGWAFLPPLQRQVSDAPPATLRTGWVDRLPTRSLSGSVGELTHLVDASAPAGTVAETPAGLGAPVPRATAADLTLRAPYQRAATSVPVQRRVVDASAPAPAPVLAVAPTIADEEPAAADAPTLGDVAGADEGRAAADAAGPVAAAGAPVAPVQREAVEAPTARDAQAASVPPVEMPVVAGARAGSVAATDPEPAVEGAASTGALEPDASSTEASGPDTPSVDVPTLGASVPAAASGALAAATPVQRSAAPVEPRRFGLGAPLPPGTRWPQPDGPVQRTPVAATPANESAARADRGTPTAPRSEPAASASPTTPAVSADHDVAADPRAASEFGVDTPAHGALPLVQRSVESVVAQDAVEKAGTEPEVVETDVAEVAPPATASAPLLSQRRIEPALVAGPRPAAVQRVVPAVVLAPGASAPLSSGSLVAARPGGERQHASPTGSRDASAGPGAAAVPIQRTPLGATPTGHAPLSSGSLVAARPGGERQHASPAEGGRGESGAGRGSERLGGFSAWVQRVFRPDVSERAADPAEVGSAAQAEPDSPAEADPVAAAAGDGANGVTASPELAASVPLPTPSYSTAPGATPSVQRVSAASAAPVAPRSPATGAPVAATIAPALRTDVLAMPPRSSTTSSAGIAQGPSIATVSPAAVQRLVIAAPQRPPSPALPVAASPATAAGAAATAAYEASRAGAAAPAAVLDGPEASASQPVVQRAEATAPITEASDDSDLGAASAATGATAAPAAPAADDPAAIETLAGRLYGPLVRRLKAELLLDRERRGIRIDGI